MGDHADSNRVSLLPRIHSSRARTHTWTVCAVMAAMAMCFFALLTPDDARAGTWMNPGSETANQGTLYNSGVAMNGAIAGSPTIDAMLGVYIPPFADFRSAALCIASFNFTAQWYSGIKAFSFDGTSWGGSTNYEEELALQSPCIPHIFAWAGDFATSTDLSANGTNPWQLFTARGSSYNLAGWKYAAGSWSKETISSSGAERIDGHIDVTGTDKVAVVATNANNLETWTRASGGGWTSIGGPTVASKTDAHGDISWVNSEPWIAGRYLVSKGKLYVHHYSGGSWLQVGTGPLNIDPVNGDVTSVAITNDANDHPYVSFVESGNVYIKQWNGTAWVSLGASVGTGATTDIVVHPRINLPYVTYSGTAAAGQSMKMWNGTSWVGPVVSKAGSTWHSSSIAIAKNQPWVSMSDGNLAQWTDRFTTSTPNAPTATGGPAALSGDTTPTLNLSGTFSGDVMSIYNANHWQVRTVSGNYSSPTWDSNWAPTGTSITTSALPDGDYCYHVQWADQQLVAGAYSEYCGWMIDTTPPPVPATRRDGTGTDIAWNNSATQISANWSVSVDNMSGTKNYDYCVTTSSSGADCAGAAVTPWTTQTGTSVTKSGLSLTQGTKYYVCVRARDNMNYLSTVGCTNGQSIDSINPTAPSVVSPIAYGIGTPALTATYNDVLPGSPGDMFFQLCADAACASVLQSGWSASGIAIGANGTFSPTSLVTGNYYWRAYGRDSAANTSPYSVITAFTVNYLPSAPTLPLPANGTWTNDTAPTFQAIFNDTLGDTGSIRFELCSSNAPDPWATNCGSSYRTVDSPTGVPIGSFSTPASFNVAYPDGTYYWRVRGVDSYNEMSSWSSALVLHVDTTTPTTPVVQSTVSSGLGAVTIAYGASIDTGSGMVTYDVSSSTNGGGSWTPQCTGITSTSCQATGIGDLTPVLMRVRACDAASNCTVWQTGIGVTGQPYYPTTTVNSGLLNTAAEVQQAVLTNPNAESADTVIQYASAFNNSGTGWWTVKPSSTNSTKLGAAPSEPNSSTGRGWIIDSMAGTSVAAGNVTIEFSSKAANTGGSGVIECRAYRVTTNGTSITNSVQIGTAGTAANPSNPSDTDVLSTTKTLRACSPGGLPAQVALAGNESIYVELTLHITTSASAQFGAQKLTFYANASPTVLTVPGSGTFPNAPIPTSPSYDQITSLMPTLQAKYTHPTPTTGSITFDVATDSGFTNIIQTGTTFNLVNNGVADFVVADVDHLLQPATTYYWRSHAVDNVGLVSGMSAPQRFVTASPPNAPTNTLPHNTATVRSATPTLVASAFSDPDTGDSQVQAHWQVRTATGSYANAVDDTTNGTDLTSHAVTPALVNLQSYCWHVQYLDSFGIWGAWSTDTCFKYDSTGGAVTVGVDSPTVAIPALGPSANSVGTTTVTISSLNETGYTLSATDASDTVGLTGASNIPDWTGTNATPTTWPIGTGGYFGLSVLSVSGTTTTKDPKWGTGSTANDFTNNKYAGLRNSTAVTLHNRPDFSTLDDVITFGYRVSSSASTPAGAYSSTVTITVVPNA
jgi:hypothetical protein